MPAALLAVAAAAWITGLVNVFNFMDGVNGISGVHALIAGAAYACYAEWGGHPFLLAASLGLDDHLAPGRRRAHAVTVAVAHLKGILATGAGSHRCHRLG